MNSLHSKLLFAFPASLLLAGFAAAQGDCSTPVPFGPAGSVGFDTTGQSTSGFNGGGTCPSGASSIGQDIFFTYTAAATVDHVVSLCGSAYDTKLAVHDGADCTATCLAYNDDACGLQSQVTVSLTAGQTVLIQVGGFSASAGAGTLTITELGGPPANDTCATPEVITGSVAVDNTTATDSGFLPSCGDPMNRDLFYAYTASCDGDLTFDLCGSTGDSKLAVYEGADCAASAACLGYNDDACSLQSSVTVTAVAGTTYLVQVGGFGASSNVVGTLNVTAPAPVNDTCATPLVIVGTGTTPYNNDCASSSGFNGGGSCPSGAGSNNQDLFYSFVVPADGDYTFDTEGSTYDTKLSIHSGSDCAATCLAYDDDGGTGTLSSITLPGLLAGDQLLIQVGAFGSNSGDGNLNISVFIDPCAGIPDDAFSPNHTCATPAAINSGIYPGLQIFKTAPDFYSFTVADGATLSVDMLFTTADGDLDCFLYDAGACSDDQNSGTTGSLAFGFSGSDNESFSWTNTTGADLPCVLRCNVWPNDSNDCNTYDLIVSGASDFGADLVCTPANANSTGGAVTLAPSSALAGGEYHLEALGGPDGEFGYFLVSGVLVDPGVSVADGILCLGGPNIGRYSAVAGVNFPERDSVGTFDATGVFQSLTGNTSTGTGFDVPTQLPFPPGGVISPGSTWYFQMWYRDGASSNFSDALGVTF